jgi:hypothetical protein
MIIYFENAKYFREYCTGIVKASVFSRRVRGSRDGFHASVPDPGSGPF